MMTRFGAVEDGIPTGTRIPQDSVAVAELAAEHTQVKQLLATSPLPDAAAIRKRGRQLIQELCDGGQYHQLRVYAAYRLVRQGLNSEASSDVVNDAVRAVLTGLEGGRDGRHPRWVDLQDMSSFVDYLQKAIKSITVSLSRHEKCLTFVQLDKPEFSAGGRDLELVAPG